MADAQVGMTGPQTSDAEEADEDSALGDDAEISTCSLTSAVTEYREENGRTYHGYKDGKYLLPNDSRECGRLDIQNQLFYLTFDDKLGFAPPNDHGSKTSRVLDVGTGTGIWAIEFGEKHPGATVIGVDLSPIQPDFVPPNVTFLIDDIEEEWTFSERFDYIHSRMMTSSIANWSEYLRQAFANLNPGGYIELQEADFCAKSDDSSLDERHNLSEYLKFLHEASVEHGRPYQDIGKLRDIMAEVGFIDIEEKLFQWPMNQWPRPRKLNELGRWSSWNMTEGLEAFAMAPFTRILGWTREQVHAFLVSVREDLTSTSIHAYWPVCSIYGMKPRV